MSEEFDLKILQKKNENRIQRISFNVEEVMSVNCQYSIQSFLLGIWNVEECRCKTRTAWASFSRCCRSISPDCRILSSSYDNGPSFFSMPFSFDGVKVYIYSGYPDWASLYMEKSTGFHHANYTYPSWIIEWFFKWLTNHYHIILFCRGFKICSRFQGLFNHLGNWFKGAVKWDVAEPKIVHSKQ